MGDICAVRFPVLACKDFGTFYRWMKLEREDRPAAAILAEREVASGNCLSLNFSHRIIKESADAMGRATIREKGKPDTFMTMDEFLWNRGF